MGWAGAMRATSAATPSAEGSTSAVQFAAEHEPHPHAGADREEREVVDTACDSGPALTDCGEIDVVLERDAAAEQLSEFSAEGAALETGDVRRGQVQCRHLRVDDTGHAENDAVDSVARQRGGSDQRLAQCRDCPQGSVGVDAAKLDVLTRAHLAP